MFTKRVCFVLLIAALAAAVLLVAHAPLARGQGESNITIKLTPYEGNPIDKGPAGSWDSQWVSFATVLFHDGLYHMFYTAGRTEAIAYATSADGLAWENYAENPVFEADGTGFDAVSVGGSAVLVEGDTWVLYYTGEHAPGTMSGVGRATAPGPTGPWTRSEDPVLTSGSPGEWDVPGIIPVSVIASSEGYIIYYYAGDIIWGRSVLMIGRATSPDGVHWTKYDDPTTTERPYAESDPVLPIGLEGWTMSDLCGGVVRQTAEGWEMFYSEKGRSESEPTIAYRIGYATSDDGIHWTKYSGFPLLTYKDDPAASASVHLIADAVVVADSTYYLYYDYHWSTGGGIGVATGTVTRE